MFQEGLRKRMGRNGVKEVQVQKSRKVKNKK
jgi:hypothetical protein